MTILIASNLGIYNDGTEFDSFLYDALDHFGEDPLIALCDSGMPACQMSKFPRVEPEMLVRRGQEHVCKVCVARGKKSFGVRRTWVFSPRPLAVHLMKQIRNIDCWEELRAFEYEGISVGMHAYASVVRYMASLEVETEEYGLSVAKLYLEAAIKIAVTYIEFLISKEIKLIIAHHGIYVPQGVVADVAHKLEIPIYCWVKSYRRDTFLFSRGKSYHYEMQEEPSRFLNFTFDIEEERVAKEYLASRAKGNSDLIVFNKELLPIASNIPNRFSLLLTSVFWDAQVHYDDQVFTDQASWISTTIRHYVENPDLGVLVIRVHPAEVTGLIPSRDCVRDRINREYGRLPNNIILIDSTDKTSTYSLIERSEVVLIYNTKAGIEAAAMGRPVVVAGDAWIKNFEFVIAAKSVEHYLQLLSSSAWKDFKFSQDQALKYFYSFYFRRMIDFSMTDFDSVIEGLRAKRGGAASKTYKSARLLVNKILQNEDVFFERRLYSA